MALPTTEENGFRKLREQGLTDQKLAMVCLRCVQATCLLGVDRNRFSITAECRESFRAAWFRTRVSPAEDLSGGAALSVNDWGANDGSPVVRPATEEAAVAAPARHSRQLFAISRCFARIFAH